MLAKELMSEIIPVLELDDTLNDALRAMDVFKLTHIPIINKGKFVGLVAESMIYDTNLPDEKVSILAEKFLSIKIEGSHHFYDVINIIAQNKLSVLPVVDKYDNYLGVITIFDIFYNLPNIFVTSQPGAVIVLEISKNDYSLSEISRIIEECNAQILSVYINPGIENLKIDVTLKINKLEIGSIISALERYNYTIKNFYSDEGQFTEMLDDNYASLMKYLSI